MNLVDKFVCPECQCSKNIVAVRHEMVGVWQLKAISDTREENDAHGPGGFDEDYEGPIRTPYEGILDRYACGNCGRPIAYEPATLVELLAKKAFTKTS